MNTNDFVKHPQQAWYGVQCHGKGVAKSTPLRIERRMFGRHLYPDYDEQARFSLFKGKVYSPYNE